LARVFQSGIPSKQMQSKFSQRIEVVTNIAIILAVILLSYFLIHRFFFQQNSQLKPPPEIIKGMKISLADMDWQANQKTLLLVLQKGCHFCSESMPFYKTLVEKSKEKGIKLVAVLPNSREEGSQYLRENGVEIQEVRQVQLNTINVKGTPTLILVNNNGEVDESWIGKLPSDKENEVIGSL
jgi:thioredoxin-related protein